MIRIKVILLLLLSTSAMAQVTIGLKGGLNVADIAMTGVVDNDAEADLDFKTGIHAGAFANLGLTEKFSLQIELLYSNKGVKAIRPVHLHYITIPVLFQFVASKKFMLETGPEIGYLFSARSDGDVTNVWSNKLDFGLDAGVVYQAFSKINFGLRFNAGFSSVQEPYAQPPNKIKFQNRVLQLSVAYAFFTKDY